MSSSVYFKFPCTLPSKQGGSWSQHQTALINSGLIIYIRAGRPLISHVAFLKFAFLEVSIWNIRLDFYKPLLFAILRLGSQAQEMLPTRFHLQYSWMLNFSLQNVLQLSKRDVLKTGTTYAMPSAGLRYLEGSFWLCETTLTSLDRAFSLLVVCCCLIAWFFVFQTGSHSVIQSNLKFMATYVPQTPEFWDYKHEPLCLVPFLIKYNYSKIMTF